MRSGIGPILADPESRIFIEQLRDEGMAVASAAGHPMPDGFAENVIALWRKLPPGTGPSMSNDLGRGRPIELAWLSGRVHVLGNELGVPTPAHTAVYRALHLHAEGTEASQQARPTLEGKDEDRSKCGWNLPFARGGRRTGDVQQAAGNLPKDRRRKPHVSSRGLRPAAQRAPGTDVEAVQVSRHRLRGCNGVSGGAQRNCRRPLLRHRPFRTVVGTRTRNAEGFNVPCRTCDVAISPKQWPTGLNPSTSCGSECRFIICGRRGRPD